MLAFDMSKEAHSDNEIVDRPEQCYGDTTDRRVSTGQDCFAAGRCARWDSILIMLDRQKRSVSKADQGNDEQSNNNFIWNCLKRPRQ